MEARHITGTAIPGPKFEETAQESTLPSDPTSRESSAAPIGVGDAMHEHHTSQYRETKVPRIK